MSSTPSSVSQSCINQSNLCGLVMSKSFSNNIQNLSNIEDQICLGLAQQADLRLAPYTDLGITVNNDPDVNLLVRSTDQVPNLNKVDGLRGQQVLYFQHVEKELINNSTSVSYQLGTGDHLSANINIQLDPIKTNPWADGSLEIVSTYLDAHLSMDTDQALVCSIPNNNDSELFRGRNHVKNLTSTDPSGLKVSFDVEFNKKTGFSPEHSLVISTDPSTHNKYNWIDLPDNFNINKAVLANTTSKIYDIQYAGSASNNPITGVYKLSSASTQVNITINKLYNSDLVSANASELPISQDYIISNDRITLDLPSSLTENEFFNINGLGAPGIRDLVGSGFSINVDVNNDGGYYSSDTNLFTVDYSSLKNNDLYYFDNVVNQDHVVDFSARSISLNNTTYNTSDGHNNTKEIFLNYIDETLNNTDSASNLQIDLSSTTRTTVVSSDRLTLGKTIYYPNQVDAPDVLQSTDLINGLVQYKVTEILNETNDNNRTDAQRLDTFRIRNNNHELHYLPSAVEAPPTTVINYSAVENLVSNSAYIIHVNNKVALSSNDHPIYNASNNTSSVNFNAYSYVQNPGAPVTNDFLNRKDNRIIVSILNTNDVLSNANFDLVDGSLSTVNNDPIETKDRRTGINKFASSWGKKSMINYTLNWNLEGISKDAIEYENALENITVSGLSSTVGLTNPATFSLANDVGINRNLSVEPLNIEVVDYVKGTANRTELNVTTDNLSFTGDVNLNIQNVKVFRVTRSDQYQLRFDPLLDGFTNLRFTTSTITDQLTYFEIEDNNSGSNHGDVEAPDNTVHEFYLRALRINNVPAKATRVPSLTNLSITFKNNAFYNASYNRQVNDRSLANGWVNGTGLNPVTSPIFIDTRSTERLNPENQNIFLSFRTASSYSFIGSTVFYLDLTVDNDNLNKTWSAKLYNYGNTSSLSLLNEWTLSTSTTTPPDQTPTLVTDLDVQISISSNQAATDEETVTINIRRVANSTNPDHVITLNSYMMSSFWIYGFSGQPSIVTKSSNLNSTLTPVNDWIKHMLINISDTKIDNGVYVKYTNTPKAVQVSSNYPSEIFKLSDNDLLVKHYSSSANQTTFTNSPTFDNNTKFIFSSPGSVDVVLRYRRGYLNTNIIGTRGRTSVVVTIGNYNQTFTNVFNGYQATLNNLVKTTDSSKVIDLGIILTFKKSLIYNGSIVLFNPISSTGVITVSNPANISGAETLRETIPFNLNQTSFLYQKFGIVARRPVSNGAFKYTVGYGNSVLLIERNSNYRMNLSSALTATYTYVNQLQILNNSTPVLVANSFTIAYIAPNAQAGVFFIWITPPQMIVEGVTNNNKSDVFNNRTELIKEWAFLDNTNNTVFNRDDNPSVTVSVNNNAQIMTYHNIRTDSISDTPDLPAKRDYWIDVKENNVVVNLRRSNPNSSITILNGRLSKLPATSDVTNNKYSSLNYSSQTWTLTFKQLLAEIYDSTALLDTSVGVTDLTLANITLLFRNTMVKAGTYTLTFSPKSTVRPYMYHALSVFERSIANTASVNQVVRRVYKYTFNDVNYNTYLTNVVDVNNVVPDNASRDSSFVRIGFNIVNIQFKDYLIPSSDNTFSISDLLLKITTPTVSQWRDLIEANTTDGNVLPANYAGTNQSNVKFIVHGQPSITQILQLIYPLPTRNKLLYMNCKDIYRINDNLGNSIYAISYDGTVFANIIASEEVYLQQNVKKSYTNINIRNVVYNDLSIQHFETRTHTPL